MKVKLQIAHQVPGRIRIKVPSVRRDPELLAEIERSFGAIPGIEEVMINPVTGSVVLKYDVEEHDEIHTRFTRHFNEYHADHASAHHRAPSTEMDALANKIEEEANFLAEHSHAAAAVVDFCRHCDRQIKLGSGNTFDLKMGLCVGIVGVVVFGVGATAATPVWVALSLFGLNHFIEMRSEAAKNPHADRNKNLGENNPAPTPKQTDQNAAVAALAA
jgi:cation transport ATPase